MIKKNILFLCLSLNAGGAERRVSNLSCALKKAGHFITVLCLVESDYYKKELESNGIRVVFLTNGHIVFRIFNAVKFIRNGNFDTVISILATPNLINCISGIRGHKWKIITGESSAFRQSQKMRGGLRVARGKIYAYFEKYADILVCNSYNAAKIWSEYYPQYTDKIRIIYNPVIINDITTKYIIRKNGRTRILVASSFQKIKNPINVTLAIASLNKSELEKVEIHWYGIICEEYERVCQLIEKYHIENHLFVHPPTRNILNIMNEMDVLGQFSMFEGLPNAVCEAMTLGKPIIMTRISDFQYLVDNSNGFLCNWNDIDSIKKAIIKCLNCSDSELALLGENSKKKASQLLNYEKIINEWEQLI